MLPKIGVHKTMMLENESALGFKKLRPLVHVVEATKCIGTIQMQSKTASRLVICTPSLFSRPSQFSHRQLQRAGS